MSTDKVEDLFGGAAAAAMSDALSADLFASSASPEDIEAERIATEFWDAATADADSVDDPEDRAKELLNEVQLAFKARAQAEQKRMEEACDSEYWVALVFQTRAQKEEFLRACGVETGVVGDKYLDGPAFAKTIGRPVTPVKIRYNISDRLDRRLTEMSRDFQELSGLEGAQPT